MTATTQRLQAEWLSEPDAKHFTDEATGYAVQIARGPGGHLCGYVGIPAAHPWFGKAYNETVKVPQSVVRRTLDIDKVGAINLFCAAAGGNDPDSGLIDMVLAVDVHGGLTYASNKAPKSVIEGLWWLGFDCAHSGDLCPDYAEKFGGTALNGIYRNLSYVEAECRALAAQLAALSEARP